MSKDYIKWIQGDILGILPHHPLIGGNLTILNTDHHTDPHTGLQADLTTDLQTDVIFHHHIHQVMGIILNPTDRHIIIQLHQSRIPILQEDVHLDYRRRIIIHPEYPGPLLHRLQNLAQGMSKEDHTCIDQ